MLFVIHGRAEVNRTKLLEVITINALPYPLRFDSDRADRFKSDLKDAMPEKELNELVNIWQRTSEYSSQDKGPEAFVCWFFDYPNQGNYNVYNLFFSMK